MLYQKQSVSILRHLGLHTRGGLFGKIKSGDNIDNQFDRDALGPSNNCYVLKGNSRMVNMRFIAFFIGFFLLYSQHASAALIGVRFEGVIHQADNQTSDAYNDPSEAWVVELESKFNVGDKVFGNFYYESEALPFVTNTNGVDTANTYSIMYAEVFMNGFFGQANGGDLSIIDGYYARLDQYVLWADPDNEISSSGTIAALFAMSLGVYDATQLMFSSGDLPLQPPEISLYPDGSISLMLVEDVTDPNKGMFIIGASLDSLELVSSVPTPSTIWLLCAGMFGLLVAGQRRRAT